MGLNKNANLDDRVDEIRYNLIKRQYKDVIELCKNLFKDLKSNDKMFYFYFCMYDVSLAYICLHNFEMAFVFAKKAMDYTIENDERIKTKWLIANCYVNKHMFNEAEKLYKKCLKYYKEADIPRSRIEVLFTLAEMKGNVNAMSRCILIMLADPNYTYIGEIQGDLNADDLVLGEAEDMANYCKLHNKQNYLFRLLNKITNKSLKKQITQLFTDMKCM